MKKLKKCAGWKIPAHTVNDFMNFVLHDGCKYCGGIDCRDNPSAAYYCDKCFDDLKNALSSDEYKILDEEGDPIEKKDIRNRKYLAQLDRAVSDALDEYLIRIHGITTSWAHPLDFLDWLQERGYTVVKMEDDIT